MEPAGLAAGLFSLAGLFNNAIQTFEYVQIGRNFVRDFETSQIKLDNARLRLSRWGQAVNIYASAGPFTPAEIELAHRNLNQILSLFANAERVSQQFQGGAVSDSEAAVYDPQFDMSARAFELHEQMRSLVVLRQKKHKRLSQRTKWALYEKTHFNGLIENVTDLIAGLERIFPVERQTRNRLCEEEVASMSAGTNLPLLEEVAAEQDPTLVEAVRRVLGKREGRLPSVEFSGSHNRGFQLGHNTGPISGLTFGGSP